MLFLAQSIGVAVYLPEAVERELESRWLRAFDEKRDKLLEHLGPVQNHLNRLPVATPAVGLPERQQVQTSYRESVKEVKLRWTIGNTPIPELGTGKLFDLAINRHVAFEDFGKNFQDTVIYLSVVDQLQKDPTPSAFLSRDAI